MNQPNQFIIEGIDRMGKTTLIEGLLQELGYRLVVHYEKPKKLRAYAECTDPLYAHQYQMYKGMFELIEDDHKIIFDRGHLGEAIYAPMYRKYSGDYVFTLEACADTSKTRLVLLTTSDFSFIKDDGLSLDFSKKEIEQTKFIDAFSRSCIEDRVLIDVSDGKGGYRPAAEILAAVLKK